MSYSVSLPIDAAFLAPARIDSTQSQLRARLAAAPADATAVWAFGSCLLWRKDDGPAVRHLARTLSIAPDAVEARMTLVVALRRAGDRLRAMDNLRVALTMIDDPARAAQAWNALGECRQACGRPNEALVAYERAIRIDPSMKAARRAAAGLWLANDARAAASAHFGALIGIDRSAGPPVGRGAHLTVADIARIVDATVVSQGRVPHFPIAWPTRDQPGDLPSDIRLLFAHRALVGRYPRRDIVIARQSVDPSRAMLDMSMAAEFRQASNRPGDGPMSMIARNLLGIGQLEPLCVVEPVADHVSSVLDFGCGLGLYKELFGRWAPAARWRYLGVDIDAASIAAARRQYGDASFRTIPADATPDLPAASCDLAFCHSVLYYTPDPARVLSALAGAATRYVFVGDMLISARGSAAASYVEFARSIVHPVHLFTIDRLLETARDLGLELVSLVESGGPWILDVSTEEAIRAWHFLFRRTAAAAEQPGISAVGPR